VAQPFATADQAIAWCTAQGFAPTQCLAKRLSHTGGPQGNTAQRPGS
jgi:serine/threonine-protein kinase